MFNLGAGEVTLLAVLALIFLGRKKLPELGVGMGEMLARLRARQLRGERPWLLLQRRAPRRWTVSDWLLVLAAVAFAAAVITNALLRLRS